MTTACLWIAAALSLWSVLQIIALARATRPTPRPAVWPSIAILRPCEGHEPALIDRLASGLSIDYPGAVQHVIACGGSLPDGLPDGLRHGVLHSGPVPDGCNRKAFHLETALAAVGADVAVVLAVDADVVITTELVEALAAAVSNGSTVGAFAPPVQEGEGFAARAGRAALAGSPHAFAVLSALAALRGVPPPFVGCACAIRRDALARVGGFAPGIRVIGDDLAMGEALARVGPLATVTTPAWCRNPAQDTGALIAQLARWIRVAVAHHPLRALAYPWMFFPLIWWVPLAASVGSARVLGAAGVVYLLRVALAWQLRERVYGRIGEAWVDPLLGDAMWCAATACALWPAPTRWGGRIVRIGAGGRVLPSRGPS